MDADARYALVERLHLRQWAQRSVAPLAALATNGAGRLDLAWLPKPAPLLPASGETSLRVAGAASVVLAAWLRVLAKGVLVRRTTLTTEGAYGVVRHPFYLANLLGAPGVFLLAGSPGAVLAAAWLVVAAPLYAVTIAGEERALARLYPREFAAYAGRVRALVPGLPRRAADGSRVSWANLVKEREPPRLLRFVAGAALVFGLSSGGAASTAALAAAGALFGTSYALR